MSLQIASETDSVQLAWLAYDEAMLRLQAMYALGSAPVPRSARMLVALEARQLWRRFIDLYENTDDPRGAA